MKNSNKILLSTLVAAAAATFAAPAFADGETTETTGSASEILINFGSGSGTGTSSITTGTWNDLTGASGSSSSLTFSDGTSGAGSVTWSSANTWKYTTNVTDGILKGYLDDGANGGNGASISVASPFLVCDVTIYCATDSDSGTFLAKTVNGTSYTYNSEGAVVEGTGTWGASQLTTITESSSGNAITISDVTGTLTISGGARDDSNRGCIAALKIVDAYTGTKTSVDASGTALTWGTSAIGETAWTNSTTSAGTYASFNTTAATTVNVSGTGITTDAIMTTGDAALTISGGSVSLINAAKVWAGGSSSIVIDNTLVFDNGGSISSGVSFGTNGKLDINGGTVSIASVTTSTALVADIASGATLDLGSSTGTVDASSVSGAGTIKFTNSGSGHGASVKLGSNFTGTLDFSGKFNTTGGVSGNASNATIMLSGGSMWGAGTLANALKFKDSFQLGDSTTTTFTLSGNITAESGSVVTVGGTGPNVTFSGSSVQFDTLRISSSSGTATVSSGTTFSATTLDARGGTLNINRDATIGTLKSEALDGSAGASIVLGDGVTATIGSVNIGGDTSVVNLKKASGATSATFAVSGNIETSTANATTRALSIDDGVTVSATAFNNGWGLQTLTVNGTLNLSDNFRYATGGLEQTITGTGTINANKFEVGNSGSYIVDGGVTLNIGSGGIVQSDSNVWGYSLTLKNAKILASDNWAASNLTKTFALGASDGSSTTFDTNGHTITLGSTLSGSGALTKTGTGTLSLSGANTISGDIVVENGTLEVANASALGTSDDISVVVGAQLKASAAVTLTGALKLFVGGENNSTALITSDGTDGNAFTLAAGTVVYIDISSLATTTDDSGTNAETLALNIATENALKKADDTVSFKIGSWTGEGDTWVDDEKWASSTFDATTGKITFSAIPEPSAFGLLAGIGALALAISRRRRRA